MKGRGSFWPLFDLVVRTPKIELRLPTDDDFADLIEVIDRGVHDPSTMPFFVPWTDAEPRDRARSSAQHWWSLRAGWSPENWTFSGAIFVGGRPVGIQGMSAQNFAVVRSVESGSWLGREHQGQGLGREMREAMLHLAFAGLGAEQALSGAFEDNPCVAGDVTRGELRRERRDEAAPSQRGGPDRPVPARPRHVGAKPAGRH